MVTLLLLLGIIACSGYGVRVHNIRGYQRYGSWTGGGARVEAWQIPCMIQPIFPVLRIKAEGQLGPLGQGSQLVMGSATGDLAVGALSPLVTYY
jgi:hypothetical protein